MKYVPCTVYQSVVFLHANYSISPGDKYFHKLSVQGKPSPFLFMGGNCHLDHICQQHFELQFSENNTELIFSCEIGELQL